MNTIKRFWDAAAGRVWQTASQRGSTLIWVMVVVLVMIIALGIGLTAASGQFNLSSVRHEEHQAYYTALSSTETIAAWITENTGDGGDPKETKVIKQLFEKIANAGPSGITIDVAGIPVEAGTCTVNLRWLDGWTNSGPSAGTGGTNNALSSTLSGTKRKQLKITSVATFAGASETVSLTLNRDLGDIAAAYGAVLKATDFSTAEYDKRAAELDAIKTTGVVAIYDDKRTVNTGFNDKDVATLNNHISAGSSIEARWTNSDLLKVRSDSDADTAYSNSLGTQRFPYDDTRNRSATDERRFVVPANGRITIDPLEEDGYGRNKTAFNDDQNTRITSLAIDNTKDKDVLFRLASGNAAKIGTNQILYTKTRTVTTKTFNDWTSRRHASLITLNFTDNAGSDKNTEDLNYRIDGKSETTYTWHPNNWNKLDIFVRSNDDVTSNLVFGPFAHKYYWGLDYEGLGEFADTWHGAQGEFAAQWPYVGNASKRKGLPYFPVDYGKNAGFWILDGRSGNYVWIMQGANVLDGTVYSTRALIIGGALIRGHYGQTNADNNYTTSGLNRSIYGFATQDAARYANYVEATTRYSQLIHNTDIILMPPQDSGTAASLIRRPDTWRDRQNQNRVPAHDKTYSPTVTIKGGTIYVGARQSLDIQGAVLDNMWISPDKIVVASEGALNILPSTHTNVLTDIYVDGGTLTISAGARIKGNIYVYNGGTVKVEGSFRLDAPDALAAGHQPGGLLIYGADTLGATFKDKDGNIVAKITDVGLIEAPAAFTYLDGNSDKLHLIGGDWADLVKGTRLFSTAGTILCDDYDPTTGRCPHYDSSTATWIAGPYDDN
jgi:type II secretory pathway pseudopilin PulG